MHYVQLWDPLEPWQPLFPHLQATTLRCLLIGMFLASSLKLRKPKHNAVKHLRSRVWVNCYSRNTFRSNSQWHHFRSIPQQSHLDNIYQDMTSSCQSCQFPPICLVSSDLPLPSQCLFLFYFSSQAQSMSVRIHSIHFWLCPWLVPGIALLCSFHLPSLIYKYIRTCRHYCTSLVR